MKKLVPAVAGMLVVITVGVFVVPRFASEDSVRPAGFGDSSEIPGVVEEDVNRRAFFHVRDALLPELPAARGCASLGEARLSESVLRESSPSGTVLFLAAERELHACAHGKAAAGAWPADPGEDELPTSFKLRSEPFGPDLDPAQTSFLVFAGQCAEGPCMGDWHLMSVDGARLRHRARFEVDSVSSFEEGGRRALALERICYDHGFGPAFSVLGVVELHPDGDIETVPFQKIRERFPQALKRYQDRLRSPDPAASAELRQVRELLATAYEGAPAGELIEGYRNAVRTLEGQGLPVHCGPAVILEWIASP